MSNNGAFHDVGRTLGELQVVDLCAASQASVASYSVDEFATRLAPELGDNAPSVHLGDVRVEGLVNVPRQVSFVPDVLTVRQRSHVL